MAGKYRTTANLYCRNGAGTNMTALCIFPKGTIVRNYGFYTETGGVKWLLVEATLDNTKYKGFCSERYLEKES